MNPRARTYGRTDRPLRQVDGVGALPGALPSCSGTAGADRAAVLDPHYRRRGGWISRPADRIAGGAGRALRHSDRVDPDRLDVPALRAATPGCAHRVHLNSEALLGGYEAADAARDDIAATYARLATLVGGRADEIALFDNANHAWN